MSYIKEFEGDAAVAQSYLLKSVSQKTQQQIRLEQILGERVINPGRIADICCGAGGLSFHLSKLYQNAEFTLVDFGDHAVRLAKQISEKFHARVLQVDCCDMPLANDEFDLVFCWQTLSWIENPRIAIDELIRICKPGGSIFASALFNTEYDVDLTMMAIDHTRTPPAHLSYSVFSQSTISKWTSHELVFHDFKMPIDIEKTSRGLGTHTVGPERMQVSGGMLMNWKILEIKKVLAES